MDQIQNILPYISAVFSLFVAFFALIRDRKSFVHRVFALGMLFLTAESVFTGFCVNSVSPEKAELWIKLRFVPQAFIPGVWFVFCASFSTKDTKRILYKWKWTIAIFLIVPVAIIIINKENLFLGPLIADQSYIWAVKLSWPGVVFFICFLAGVVLSLSPIELALRTSAGNYRWQIKFFIFGVACILISRVFTLGQIILFQAIKIEWELINDAGVVLGVLLMEKSFFRTRSLNFQFYFSDSLLHNSFSLIIVGAYFLFVSIIANYFYKSEASHYIAFTAFLVMISIVGLFSIIFSDKIKKKSKIFLSRHFKRPLYDYRKEWENFTRGSSFAADLYQLCNSVVRIVSKTFDCLSVTIWVKDKIEDDAILGASTVLSEIEKEQFKKLVGRIRKFLGMYTITNVSFEHDFLSDELPNELHWFSRKFFEDAQIRYCVPLMIKDELVGIMTLGKRVGDSPLEIEEFDLLKTMADQLASSIYSVLVAEELKDAKQMEALQCMSAFFVHDFKNLANKLSLTLQNLPKHLDNPEFRKDAIKSISNSVEKIRSMSDKLVSLSQKIELNLEIVGLNELASAAAAELNGALEGKIIRKFHSLPDLHLDTTHFRKVITNLILNAQEASDGNCIVEVETGLKNGCVFLSVRDYGIGISEEFIETSLFHPFKTTKKNGMGIGLYHSRKIVEAHGGKIGVESKIGEGTTFTVLLPLAGEGEKGRK